MWEMQSLGNRRYRTETTHLPSTSEDLHAWSIFRQNLNSDFTDSALGSSEKSPMPYGNFHLRESTMKSILSNPKYGPKSELGTNNMYTYLKFGLPRVLPPKVFRENSSGYDSTDEDIFHGNKLRNSKSEDFLHVSKGYNSQSNHLFKSKSRSISNLIAPDSNHERFENKEKRKMGQGSSVISLPNKRGLSYKGEDSMLNSKYFPKDNFLISSQEENENESVFKIPHFIIKGLTLDVKVNGKYKRLLDDISLEINGGEIMAVMATNRDEGTALLETLSSSYSSMSSSELRGDLFLNGIHLKPLQLRNRVSFVRQNINFAPDMSVRQTLLFNAFFKEPGTPTRSFDSKGRINALIEDLGLSVVKHTRVQDLTVSEKMRLNVAIHLLLDTDIILLDEPTRGMDIFDTFFLVEYLRQWASRGRIVILTLHPPTYEILTMISKVLLLSTARVMFTGKRRDMLSYFTSIDYPCPTYKNPSDYYLDLVTLDDLSSEAMLESSQRIDLLANTFKRRMEPLSDPGLPGVLIPPVKEANLLVQIFGLWIRALIYMYPFNVINWVKMVLLSGTMSCVIGSIFVGIRWRYWDISWQADPLFEQINISDRLFFHYSVMVVGIWPTYLAFISEAWHSKPPVQRDIEDRLYTKFAYILTHTLYSIPSSGGIFLAYIIPSYLLAGIHYPDTENLGIFYRYIGYMMLYMFSLRNCILPFVYIFESRHYSAMLSGLFLMVLSLVCGIPIHKDDLGPWTSWLSYISPLSWMSYPIFDEEFTPLSVFRCSDNPVISENSIIIKQIPCGLSSGKDVLSYFLFRFPESSGTFINSLTIPLLYTMALLVVMAFFSLISFMLCSSSSKKRRQ